MIDPADFDFALPDASIAQIPPARRADARVLRWSPAGFDHHGIGDVPAWIRPGDLVVLNDTRVFPARLRGVKEAGSAQVEVLLIAAESPDHWTAMVRPGRRLAVGATVGLEGGARIRIGDALDGALRRVQFLEGVDGWTHAREHGHIPLPPYIQRDDDGTDRERYQTVYAQRPGSVAAPTAGLHFDRELLASMRNAGADLASVTLHVGPGTFRPPTPEQLQSGRLHREEVEVSAAAIEQVQRAKRVIAIGTTTCRALESLPDPVAPLRGPTELFIQPGYRFRFVDVLLTNFHLPRSSLLMLVAAFAGARWRVAYELAVAEGYRFYSYGDANWIEREP